MLQRAASNAYSWWWASHVRTKQSKWLEQSLQDMGEKVEAVMKLIEEDGDSFAKRAEMYYKKRPELISFVEESYRAYRSLAERYDHISKELQNANSTLASAFPDQFQYPMDDDDEYSPPKVPRKFSDKHANPNIPKAPSKFPAKNIKAFMALTTKSKDHPKSGSKSASNAHKSGLTKPEALNEIDKFQKKILTLQTEKEFAKSSYDRGYAKYWEIEEEITGMQEKISKLQDEFGVTQVIEDDEARTLMAEAALKSCQETLAQLQEKQETAAAEAKAERQKIKDARQKLKSIKGDFLGTQDNQTDASEEGDPSIAEESRISFDDDAGGLKESKAMDILRDKIKEHFDVGPVASLTVSEMAEKIDELVNKVINLETAVSSQTALIHTLRSETDDLQSQIKTLEDDKANLTDGKNTLSEKLMEMENKLNRIQDINRSFENQNSSLETHFTEARSNLDTISEKLHNVKPDEEVEESSSFQEDEGFTATVDVKKDEVKEGNDNSIPSQEGERESKPAERESKASPPSTTDDKQPQEQPSQIEPKPTSLAVAQPQERSNKEEEEQVNRHRTPQQEPASLPKDEPDTQQGAQQKEPVSMPIEEPNVHLSVQPQEQTRIEEDKPDWQQLFTTGLEGKEKVLLAEYTSTLRNYKEAKKKLGEMEKKTQDDLAEIASQLKELKISNAMKDNEIHSLRQKLSVLQKRLDEYRTSKEVRDVEPATRIEYRSLPPENDEDIKIIASGEEREISPVEEQLRADIDEILEENLDFWMRFSTSFGQIQKFQNGVEDLHAELEKLEKDHEKKEGSGHGSSHGSAHMSPSLKSDVRPLYKHLREIQTELTVWLEQSEKLKDELQRRFTQLCNIEEEIKRALNAGAEDDDMKFTNFQAVKFQGEVANMQQENHKVADELQAGMDHITSLQLEVERTITRLNEELGLSGSKSQNENQMRSESRGRVPLRSFIFGVKPQKKKQSIFSCMHPAMMHRRYQHLKTDKSL